MFAEKSAAKILSSNVVSSHVTVYNNSVAQLAGTVEKRTNGMSFAPSPLMYVTSAKVEGVTLVGGSQSTVIVRVKVA